jgi:ankyrin repeat protein
MNLLASTTFFILLVATVSKCMLLCDVTPQNINELFLQVAKAGQLELVKLLILDPNLCDIKLNWALMEAARNGHVETVKFLLLDPRIALEGSYSR